MKKVALVTGASSGIGKSTAEELCKNGFTVYAAARRLDRMKDIEKDGIIPVSLDLTDDESIKACADFVINVKTELMCL